MRVLTGVLNLSLIAVTTAACGDGIVPSVTLGGTVSGLAGSGLVLRASAGDELAISGDGAFTFPTALEYGAAYEVTIASQPVSPAQACTISKGTGTVHSSAAITDLAVTCETHTFMVGGTVSGLTGTGLVLDNNGGDELAISADGSFTFATPVTSGAAFAVTVKTQPGGPTQTCSVAGGTGTIGAGPVTTVVVDCAVDRFTIGGIVSGLAGTVVLEDGGGNEITVSSNGSFAFPSTVASGASYAVSVKTQPSLPSQTCVITSDQGIVISADITSVRIDCTTNTFSVGGTVTGLAGTGLVLQNNAGDDLPVAADGSFTFATPVASGAGYAVTVLTQPSGPTQDCVVTSGTGTVGGAAVTGVVVTCTTSEYTVGGTVGGLTGTGLVLRNSGGDDLAIGADGSFTFATPVGSGATYAVTVATQPSGQSCSVANGTGTIDSANITNVAVTCASGFSTAGLPATLPGTIWNSFGSFTFDGAGDLLAVSGGAPNKLYSVSRTTNAVTSITLNLTSSTLVSIAYDKASDTVYVGDDSGKLYRWSLTTSSGGMVATLAGVGGINALAFAPAGFGDHAGRLCGVGTSGALACLELSSNTQSVVASGMSMLSSLVFDDAGFAYAGDSTGTIRRITATGTATAFATGVGTPDGLAIDLGRGRLYVADSSGQKLWHVSLSTGAATAFAGTYAFDGGYWPSPIAFDGVDTLLIAVNPGAPTKVSAVAVP